jgi:hypothetical protein
LGKPFKIGKLISERKRNGQLKGATETNDERNEKADRLLFSSWKQYCRRKYRKSAGREHRSGSENGSETDNGMGHSESDISKLCPAARVLKGLPIRGGSVQGAENDMAGWLRKLGEIE